MSSTCAAHPAMTDGSAGASRLLRASGASREALQRKTYVSCTDLRMERFVRGACAPASCAAQAHAMLSSQSGALVGRVCACGPAQAGTYIAGALCVCVVRCFSCSFRRRGRGAGRFRLSGDDCARLGAAVGPEARRLLRAAWRWRLALLPCSSSPLAAGGLTPSLAAGVACLHSATARVVSGCGASRQCITLLRQGAPALSSLSARASGGAHAAWRH
jgi:hypothetical protein